MIKKLSFLLFLGLVTFLLLELSIMFLTQSGQLNILMPTYQMNPHEDFLPLRSQIYGRQHLPNSNYRIRKNCLNVDFEFNALGFRDQLPDKIAKSRRFLVIGDSFVEGVGVNEKDRFSDLLEQETGLPFLNFGMADKGSTQEFLIYDSIASQYEHESVIWTIFPTNDLIDDDPKYGKNENSIKPCWIGKYPNYDLQFVPETAPMSRPNNALKRFLKAYTYTYDALFYLKQMWKTKQQSESYPLTGYFNYSEDQVARLLYSMEKMKASAGDKPMYLICIPSHLDLDEQNSRTQANIEGLLKAHCDSLGIQFIGLYDLFKSKNWKAYYLDCDSHWNENGHKLVADYLLKQM